MFTPSACLVLAATCALTNLSQRPLGLTPLRYDLDVRIDYDAQLLHGSAKILLMNDGDVPAAAAPLLLYRLMTVTEVVGATGRHVAFEQDVVRFEDFDKLQSTFVRVEFNPALGPGDTVTIQVAYEGRLLGYSETPNRYVRETLDPSFTILRKDAFAYPVVAVPSSLANRAAPIQKFDYRASITVPDSLFVANGGTLLDRTVNSGLATYVYESVAPSWRMDFAIGPYQKLDQGPLSVFSLKQDSLAAGRVARQAIACLGLMETWFGPLKGGPRLTLIEIPNGFGSQKDVVTVLQSAAAFQDSTRANEIYHELAHLWQPVDTDAPSPRWNEGLSSFLEHLAFERLEGDSVVERRGTQLVQWLAESLPGHPDWAAHPMVDYGQAQMTDLSYSVGAIFFEILYRTMGEEAFMGALADFYGRYGATGANTEDLVTTLSRHTPTDLTPIYRDWLYTTRWAGLVAVRGSLKDLVALYGRGG